MSLIKLILFISFIITTVQSIISLIKFFKNGFSILKINHLRPEPLVEKNTIKLLASFGYTTSYAGYQVGGLPLCLFFVTLNLVMFFSFVAIDKSKRKKGYYKKFDRENKRKKRNGQSKRNKSMFMMR